MDDETNSSGLVAPPIMPSLPEVQASSDAMALLNTPPPFITPVVPSGTPINIGINEQVQGDFHTGPAPGKNPGQVKQKGTLDFVKAATNYMADDQTVKDPYKYGRAYSYGAGYKNQNFDRYYKHNKFQELGFSPYRDNDAIYNEKGSWWDDFSRMRGEWHDLAWSGFKSVWGDEGAANEAMEKGMAIGSSSRGGLGGGIINFGLNSAYTVGIIGELALEDVAIAAIEYGTGGLATPLIGEGAVVRNSMAFGRLIKAWKGTYEFMKTLKSAEKAKELFTAAKAGEKLTDFAKWANPFQRSMEWSTHLAQGTGGVANLRDLAKVSKTFGNYYRDIRELNMAHSEAKLEGEGASKEYQQKLIDDFYNENGRMPNSGEEAQKIYDSAQSVKSTVTLANDATIYFTNKLVFEDLFEGIRPGAKIADAFLEGTGRFMKRTAAKDFKAGAIDAVQAGIKTTGQKAKDFLTKSVYVPWSRQYFLGNLGEALQENAQEVITQGALDYYDKIHSDPSQLGFYGSMASIGKGVGDQFSAKGAETFLSGFMMGSLIQAGGKGIKTLGQPIGRGAQAATYAATSGKYGKEWSAKSESELAKEQGEKTDNDVMKAANFVAENALIYGGHRADIAAGIKTAVDAKNQKTQEGDEKTARDMRTEVQINHYDMLARTNNMGVLTEHIDDMLTLNDDDLVNAYNNKDTAENIRAKLNKVKDRAEGYQRSYDKAKRIRPNPHNPWLFDSEKQPEAYNQEMNDYMAHERAISDVLFATQAHMDIADRMVKMGNEFTGNGAFENFFNVMQGGTPIANAAGQDISVLIDPTQLSVHMKSLEDQISVLSLGTPEQKKEAIKLKKSHAYLKEWRILAHTYNMELKSTTSAAVSPAEQQARRQRANMRTGATVIDRTTGEELTVHRHVVGTNKSGTILKTKDGRSVLYDVNKHNMTKQAPGAPTEFADVEGDNASWLLNQMYNTFNKYVKHVANTKDGYVFDDQMNKGFGMLKDFMALKHDQHRMVHTINKLSDPEMFQRYKDIQSKIQGIQRSQKTKNLEKALEKFQKMAAQNKMLNELFDLGLFVLPEDVKKILDYTPTDFYNVTDKSLLSKSDPKYKQVLDIMEKYAEAAGQILKGKDIAEAKGEDSRYNAQARKKFRPSKGGVGKDDRRTFKDHAKQFGFDPKAEKSTVPTNQVLQSIIDSPYATTREKMLARRLLAVVKPGRVITFVSNNDGPGYYDGKETVVDARYSSENYTIGENGHPIEHVILHELLHELTVEGLTSDPEFMKSIQDMMVAVQAYMQSPDYTSKYGNKPLYGMSNPQEFVAEALTNDTFQSMLKRVAYKSTGKADSVWDEFINSISKFFERIFGVTQGSSVLDEALVVITSKIDGKALTKAEKEMELAPGQPVLTTTPINQIRLKHNKLFNNLIAAYRKYSEDTLNKKIEGTNDELVVTDGFKKFVGETASAFTVIQEYNKDNKLGSTPQPIKTKGPQKGIISDDALQQFYDTGVIPKSFLERLAAKIIDKTSLSENEKIVYDAKKADINTMVEERKAAIEKEKAEIKEKRAIATGVPTLTTVKGDLENFDIPQLKAALKQLRQKLVSVREAERTGSTVTTPSALIESDYNKLKEYIEIREVSLQEVIDETEDIMEQYANITTREELNAWKIRMQEIFESPNERDEFAEKYLGEGNELTPEYAREMVTAKMKALAENLDPGTLTEGSIVIMRDKGNSIKYVAKNDGKSLLLVTPSEYKSKDFSAGETVANEDIKTKILMKDSEFKEAVEQTPPPSAETVKEFNEGLETASEDPSDEILQAMKAAENTTSNAAESDLFNDVNNCVI